MYLITCYLPLGMAPCPFEYPALAPYAVMQTQHIRFKIRQRKKKYTTYKLHKKFT